MLTTLKGVFMTNEDVLKGKWDQLKGDIKKKWGKITDDEIKQIQGQRDRLVGKIQERYGRTAQQAKKEVNDFLKS